MAPRREEPRAKTVADMMDDKASALRRNALRKMKCMAEKHMSEWYNLSLNKEADERGSRALVSVARLRRPLEDVAWTDLEHMTAVSKDYFETLHSPEPTPMERLLAQDALIEEVEATYHRIPGPDDFKIGPFTEEVLMLRDRMPNTAPGPDGIPYEFWKRLCHKLQCLQGSPSPP